MSLTNQNAIHSFSRNSASQFGGALAMANSISISSGALFEGNTSGGHGGAIYVGLLSGAPLNTATITLGNAAADITFKGNSAGVDVVTQNLIGRGGAVYSQGSLDIESKNLVVTGNKAMADGGAFYLLNGFGFVGGFDISNNSAGSGTSTLGSGGAVYNEGDVSITALSNSSFANNLSSDKGGAFYIGGTAAGQGSFLSESGDIVFQGNKHGVTDTRAGSANAIYIDSPNYTLNFSASAQRSIYFYDPISSDNASQIVINISPAGQAGQILFSGEQYSAGTADVFSSISADTTVHAGSFAVKDNARFGNANAGSFSVLSGANLNTIAAKQGVTNYLQAWNFDIAGGLNFSGQASRLELLGDVNSSGRMSLLNNNVGDVLFIDGDYTGNNAYLTLETLLGGDGSPSDLVNITGTATGLTNLKVENLGGAGALAPNGILVISTGRSDVGAFKLVNDYVSAGAYDYSLLHRSELGADNWYLQNGYDIDGDGKPDPEAGPTYTPNLGSAIANTTAANQMFNMRFEDREGAGQQQMQRAPEDNLWVRYSGNKNSFTSLSEQLHTDGNTSAVQVGIGLPSLLDSESFDIGVMAGYGHYSGKTTSSRTDRKSSSRVNGYSLGVYGTWFSNPDRLDGMYVDSWLQWGKFNNRVRGADYNNYSYDSSGVMASIEVGANLEVGQFGSANVWVQPQAQVIYQGVRADAVKEKHSIDVKRGNDNVQLRTGIKTYTENVSLGDTSIVSRPFIELNYIHNTEPYSTKIDGKTYRAAGGKDIGEVRLGLESRVANDHQLWFNYAYADGGKNYRDQSVHLGWKYDF